MLQASFVLESRKAKVQLSPLGARVVSMLLKDDDDELHLMPQSEAPNLFTQFSGPYYTGQLLTNKRVEGALTFGGEDHIFDPRHVLDPYGGGGPLAKAEFDGHQSSSTSVSFAYEAPAQRGNTPWKFRTHVSYSLGSWKLTVKRAVTNTGTCMMPLGIADGLVLKRSPRSGEGETPELQFLSRLGWEKNGRPVFLLDGPPDALSAKVRPNPRLRVVPGLDVCYVLNDQNLRVSWPGLRLEAKVNFDPTFCSLAVHSSADFFAFHAGFTPNGANLDAAGVDRKHTGFRVLEPEETHESVWSIDFRKH